MFTIISWFTKDTKYEGVIKTTLLPSLSKFDNIRSKIYPIKANNNWLENTNLKPFVIQKAIWEINTDLLILDADCTLNQYPKLIEEIPEEYDCAMFYLPWNEWYQNGSNKLELCTGTLFFRDNFTCRSLIEKWCDQSLNNPHKTDQQNLEITLENFKEPLKIYMLPYEYCWINSLPNGKEPFVKRPDNVVVEHFQASRTLRREIK